LIERFSKQIMNPDMFGKRMAFGISDMAKKLMARDATAEQIEESLFGIAKTLQPMIDAQRQSLEMQGLDQDVILQRLGDYFGSQELVTLSEAITKLQPKEIVPDIGEKQDPFANLITALEKAVSPLQELATKMIPYLVDWMGVLVRTLTLVATVMGLKLLVGGIRPLTREMAKFGISLARSSAATSKLFTLGTTIGRFGLILSKGLSFLAGPVGILISLLLTFLPELLSWFGSGEDDEAEAEKKRAAEEERKRLDAQRQKAINDARAALNYKTNSLLELQSQTLNRTMQDIIFGTDLSKRLLNVNEEQKSALLALILLIQNNSRRSTSPFPGD